MEIGAIYPQTELRGYPAALDAIGRGAEAIGYDGLVLFDHVAGAEHRDRTPPLFGPYTHRDPFHDPLVAFAYLAGVTNRIGLATGILVLPQRQTLLVERQAANVDLLSGGRLRLGVGAGWNYVEFEALGAGFGDRGRRMEEQIGYLRRLWAEPLVSMDGTFHKAERIALNPCPGRPIPVWLGGLSEAAYQRAARLGDGFVFSGDIEACVAGWRAVARYLNVNQRPVSGFGAEYLLPPGVPADEAPRYVDRWREAGGTHVAVRTMGLGFAAAEEHLDYLAAARDRIGRA